MTGRMRVISDDDSDAGRPPTVAEPLAALVRRARALASAGTRTLLGIAGAPGAGKSTLVEALAAGLGDRAAVVAMDGYHLANVQLERLGRRARKGAPDTFDVDGYVALLRRLRANEEPVIYAPLFDRAIEESVAAAVAVPRDVPLVITEGNYLLLDDGDGWAAVRGCLDQAWFLDLPDDERTARLVARHERYGMAAEDAAARATVGTDGRNAVLVQGTRDRADLIVHVTD